MRNASSSVSARDYGRMLEGLFEQAAAYAHSILRNREDAEDAVQQAALRGLEGLRTYDPARSFKAWWFVVLRHCCLDLVRARRSPAGALDLADPPAAPPRSVEDWEELAVALERVGPEQAEILRLKYFGQLSYRELSHALDIPVGTVMSRLHQARKSLAAEMESIRT